MCVCVCVCVCVLVTSSSPCLGVSPFAIHLIHFHLDGGKRLLHLVTDPQSIRFCFVLRSTMNKIIQILHSRATYTLSLSATYPPTSRSFATSPHTPSSASHTHTHTRTHACTHTCPSALPCAAPLCSAPTPSLPNARPAPALPNAHVLRGVPHRRMRKQLICVPVTRSSQGRRASRAPGALMRGRG